MKTLNSSVCRNGDFKPIRVVGMETENPSVAELTAKNPKGAASAVPFSTIERYIWLHKALKRE